MTAYKVRHKASGLYYKPGQTNLDKKGKLYPSKATVLSMCGEHTVTITVMKRSRIYSEYIDMFKGWDERYDYVVGYFKADDFELVEIPINVE